jgi:hypothetical protein
LTPAPVNRRAFLLAGGAAVASAPVGAVTLAASDASVAEAAAAPGTTVYVATGGSDSNNGQTWATAKATIQAAIAALPPSPDGTTGRSGVVELGYGTFTVTSSHRVDSSCSIAATAATVVNDPACVEADLGSLVVSAQTPACANGPVGAPQYQIVAVTPGVSFTLNQAATGTGSGLAMTIIRPGVFVPAGVSLRGGGGSAATGQAGTNFTHMYGASVIQDDGSDVAVALQSGGGEDATAVRQSLERLTVWGNSANTIGLWSVFNWMVKVDECDISNHGLWGVVLQGNGAAQSTISNTLIRGNGSPAAAGPSGGIAQSPGAVGGITLTNVAFIGNFGVDAYNVSATFIGCTTAGIGATGWSGMGGATCFYLWASAENSIVNLWDCWFEGGTYAQVVLAGSQVAYSVKGCLFEGMHAASFGLQAQGQVSCQDSVFLDHAIAAVNATSNFFTWTNCFTNDASFVTGFNGTLPAATAPSPGAYNQASVTAPPAPTAVALTSGTAWQNTTGYDVILAIPISFSSGGRATIARGPTSAPPTLGTVSRRSSESDLLEYYVPAQWYVEVTLSGASFATSATAQPV